MTATQTQLRRGTSSQCDSMTPAEGELIVDLTNDRPRLGDGTTAGGIHIPNFEDIITQTFSFDSAGGTADALTIDLPVSPGSYSQPLTIYFKATATNTGAATIDVNGLGTKNLYKVSGGAVTSVVAGDIVNGGLYMAIYDGTQFQIYGLTSAGLTSVSQGDLNTSLATGTFSAGTSTVLAGGEYGLGLLIGKSGSATFSQNLWAILSIVPDVGGFSPNSRLAGIADVSGSGSSPTGTYSQRYITSSPPFDMGDGDAGGFIFVQVNGAGEVVQHYAADVPPWAYNGPTNIRCDYQCPVTKKKFRTALKKLTPQEVMNGAEIKYEKQEITQEIKNADMDIIPHPFTELPGHKIVMLDPMSDKIQRLIELQNKGDSSIIEEMIYKGHLRVDSDKVSRKGPKGVSICAATYRAK